MKRSLLRLFLVATVALGVLAVVSCKSSSSSTSSTTTGGATSSATTSGGSGKTATIDLTVQSLAFDKTTISVPAGATVTINFNNKDSGISHNFAAYTDSSASKSIYVGKTVSGPATTTYTFTAPSTPGNYFFRCDVHPTQMTGTLTVTP